MPSSQNLENFISKIYPKNPILTYCPIPNKKQLCKTFYEP